jgi:hypothetical protein
VSNGDYRLTDDLQRGRPDGRAFASDRQRFEVPMVIAALLVIPVVVI